MATINDGGQAFPAAWTAGPSGDLYPPELGMSLRDWFAGQALAAIIAADGIQYAGVPKSWATHAAMAYAHADAMIAAKVAP